MSRAFFGDPPLPLFDAPSARRATAWRGIKRASETLCSTVESLWQTRVASRVFRALRRALVEVTALPAKRAFLLNVREKRDKANVAFPGKVRVPFASRDWSKRRTFSLSCRLAANRVLDGPSRFGFPVFWRFLASNLESTTKSRQTVMAAISISTGPRCPISRFGKL